MPFSTFIFRGQTIEVRDSQLIDFVDFMEANEGAFSASDQISTDEAWLKHAISDWKKECEMPPGCKVIRSDKWLTSADRVRLFLQFLNYISGLLEHGKPEAPKLAAEVNRVKEILNRSYT